MAKKTVPIINITANERVKVGIYEISCIGNVSINLTKFGSDYYYLLPVETVEIPFKNE